MQHKTGDSHNGGHCVQFEQGVWHKPRSVYWESLFLHPNSPLRTFIQPHCIMPCLNFTEATDHCTEGWVQNQTILTTQDSTPVENLQTWASVGSTIALLSVLGVYDLHRDNMAIGFDPAGNFVFGPLDVECLGFSFELVSNCWRRCNKNCLFAAICFSISTK